MIGIPAFHPWGSTWFLSGAGGGDLFQADNATIFLSFSPSALAIIVIREVAERAMLAV
jgi:hypothetical protein